jgi:hypothetical protein
MSARPPQESVVDLDRLNEVLPPGLRAAALLVLLIFVIGRIPILQFLILPFVIVGVVVHELAHALASLLTGGRFGGMMVKYDTATNYVSGAARVGGGNDLLVTNAGYVGTLLVGGLLLVVAASEVSARLVVLALGLGLLFVGLVMMRNAFGRISAVLVGVGLVLIGRQMPEVIAKGVLWILAVTMILDTFFDLVHVPSDAKDLHKRTGIDFGFWIVLWWGLAAVILLFALNRAYGVPLPWTLLDRGG